MQIDITIAICIVSFERANQTKRCIESLIKHTSGRFHIYLVDNASTDKQTQLLIDGYSTHPQISVFRLDKNYGPAYARNVVLKKTKDLEKIKFYAMLDNDMVALPGWDDAASSAIDRGADLVQPKLLTADGMFVDRGPNHARPEVISANPEFIGMGFAKDHVDVCREEEAAIVGAGIFKRSVFEKIGYYDEDLHIGEDFDLSFRARAAGFSIRYVPSCELIHDHVFNLEYDQERAKTLKYLVSHLIIWKKHQKVLLSPAYLKWYSWLHFNNEPMYIENKRSVMMLVRRVNRKINRAWIMKKYPQTWASTEAAEQETSRLEDKLGSQGKLSIHN